MALASVPVLNLPFGVSGCCAPYQSKEAGLLSWCHGSRVGHDLPLMPQNFCFAPSWMGDLSRVLLCDFVYSPVIRR